MIVSATCYVRFILLSAAADINIYADRDRKIIVHFPKSGLVFLDTRSCDIGKHEEIPLLFPRSSQCGSSSANN